MAYIALCMQGITTKDKNEVKELLNTIIRCDGDTNYMHEGFNKDNPKEFTRDWFAWANSLFADFIYKINKRVVVNDYSFLYKNIF